MADDLIIRRAETGDLAVLGALAGKLVRMHHAADPSRFLLVDDVEDGYRWWFSRELKRAEAVILVASKGMVVLGYGYGTMEGRNWNQLLDAHGEVQDVFVVEEARRTGVGKALVDGLVKELEALGAPRVVLSTMVRNEAAQRCFQKCGFRPTMLEMTRDRSSSLPSEPGTSR